MLDRAADREKEDAGGTRKGRGVPAAGIFDLVQVPIAGGSVAFAKGAT